MTHRTASALFIALALGSAGGVVQAQGSTINDYQAPVVVRSQVPVVISNSTGLIATPGAATQVRAYNGYAPQGYAAPNGNYPAYPGYAPPCNNYPSYPNHNYGPSTYGASVSISTPGFQDNNFRLFPYSTTVTTWGSNSGNCAPQYPRYHSYPAYPTYVPGPQINGYRGAADGEAKRYNYRSHSMVNGSYVGPNGLLVTPPYSGGNIRR